ncbi:hypothetical protein M0F12_24005 [Ralstonia solanacearum]|nr:hypothetical protein [Ralstonia solanacearum]MCL9856936.1 hypothetical protein [Ralstonia solanacearum]MCL9861723.1 hypothetical protein [Ralstonia solanacearum]MCL9866571.1 hypothetical protein [Ralstonia solanacearum]MCL9871348.1 hypothetical protein [Ralstonia solanacearum]
MQWLKRIAEVGLAVLVYRLLPALITAWQTAGAAAVTAASATSAAWATANLSMLAAIHEWSDRGPAADQGIALLPLLSVLCGHDLSHELNRMVISNNGAERRVRRSPFAGFVEFQGDVQLP